MTGTADTSEHAAVARAGPDRTPPASPRWRPAVLAGLIGYVTLAAFPGWYMPPQPGLDPSWVYALNRLPHTPYGFGPDLAFTYGPLGRLLYPMPIEGNLGEAAVSWMVFSVALAGAVSLYAARERRPIHLAAFAAIFVTALGFGLPYEYWWSLVVGLLLLLPVSDRVWPWAAVVASLGAAALMFAKTTMGVAGLSMLVLFAAARLLTRTAPPRMLLSLFVPYLVGFFAIGGILVGPPPAVLAWFFDSLELARGFALSMSVPGPTLPVLAGLAAVASYAGILAWSWFRDREGFVLLAALSGVVYVGFRHAYVRHQGRYIIPAVLGALAVVAIRAGPRARLLAVGGAATVAVAMGGVLASQPVCLCPFRWDYPTAGQGWSNLSRAVGLQEAAMGLREQGDELLEADVLPRAWRERIRAAGEVDVLPWEIAYTAANDLAWRPNPVIQTYHAYTARLDRDVAAHLSSPEGPPHLLVQFADIDGRQPLWSSPATWRAVLSHYQLSSSTTVVPGVALLTRRPEPVSLSGEPLGSSSGRIGEWIEIPSGPALVFAEMDLDMDLDGTLAALVWRIDPVLVDFRFPGGMLTVRMLPATVENGALASHIPFNFSQFIAFLEGRLPPRATAFRIRGPGVGSYAEHLTVRWRGADWVPRLPRGAGAASAG